MKDEEPLLIAHLIMQNLISEKEICRESPKFESLESEEIKAIYIGRHIIAIGRGGGGEAARIGNSSKMLLYSFE